MRLCCSGAIFEAKYPSSQAADDLRFDLLRGIVYLSKRTSVLSGPRVGDQMTKWVALALGALLSLGGAVSIWNGVDVIQSERGWVAVIAGSVALTGGVVTFSLFLLIREVQALRAGIELSARVSPIPPPPPRAVPVVAEELPPVLPEPPVAPAPAHVDSAPAAPLVAVTAHKEQPVPEAPPHESLVFEQVFPLVPVAPTPVATPSERFRFRSTDAAISLAAGAAAMGMFARSKASSSSQEPPATEPQLPPEAAPQGQDDASAETVPSPESVLERPEEALLEPQAESSVEQVSGGADVAPKPDEANVEGGEASKEDAAVSPGYAWLERALAREEGRKSPALDWLRTRPPTESLIVPVAPAPVGGDDEAPPAAEALEPKESAPEAPAEAVSTDESAAAPEQPPVAEPGVLGRYSSGGSDYTLYSDGSIDAQTEQGLFRFGSMAELRAYIEGQTAQS